MSTISPSATRDFAARLAKQGVAMLDAPVSGGSEGAKKGTLSIFVGGEAGDLERARPVLAAMGTTITHVGPIGAGQATKAVNQVIIAGTYLGVAEGIVLAIKAGLDVERTVLALSGGAAQSWVLANRSGRMLANDYPLGFKVSLHRKDLGIALQLARETGAALPVSALCEQIEAGLIGAGHGDDDMSAVARAIRSLSGAGGLSRPVFLLGRPHRLRDQDRTKSVEADQEQRPTEPPVVARPEPLHVVHLRRRRRGAPRPPRSGRSTWAYLPSRIRPFARRRRPRRGPSRRWRTSIATIWSSASGWPDRRS